MALAACGGGGDGGGETPPAAAPLAGVFIDSPVAGLGYSAAPSGLSGVTNANGQLNYQPGDQITFNLGGRSVGNTVPGAPIITALQVFGANSVTDTRVLNLSQLLLTLGGVPAGQNPIQLPATIPAGLPSPLNFSDPNFDTIIQNTLPAGTTLVSEAQATSHLQAQFSTVSVTLTGAGAGSGSVTSSPAGISCTGATTCPAVFANGTSVTLTATGSGFAGWSGGTGNAAGCTGTGPCVISNLSGNSGVTATFNPPPPVTLSVTKSGSGSGTVTSNPAGINCGSTCSAQFTGGTPVTMTATADAGSTFTGWSNGTGSVTCTGTGTCAATLNATSAVQATFVLNVTQFSVTPGTATANGGGGTVQCSADGGAAGPCGSYNVGTAVTITASPNTISNFTGWSGGTGNAAGCTSTGPCVITSLTANTTVTANFNRPVLSVQVSGTGTVNSSPAGISNCTTNCSAPYDKSTVVALSASGSGFTGWSGGGCSGTGTCQVTVTSNVSVTATFGGAVSSSPFFQFIQDNDGGPLLVIDPAAPGSAPVQVVATQEGGRYVYTASYSANSITNVRTPYLGYISGGKLWKVTADKTINSAIPGSTGNLPIQVSSESAANNVCNGFVFHGITNINNSRIIYELAGSDNNCTTRSNNVTKMIKFGDSSSTPPTVFATGVVPTDDDQVFDLSTGALSHIFLVDTANSNTLKVLDTLTDNITTSQANVGSVRILAQDTSNRVFLMSTSKLYLYTISTNTLTELVAAAPGSFLVSAGDRSADSTHLYVVDATPGIVKKVPLIATGPGDVATHYTASASVLQMQLTENRIVLRVSSNPCGQTIPGSEGLVSVRKDNSATTTNLVPVAPNTCVDGRTSGSNVFYSKTVNGTQTAHVVTEDGTVVIPPIAGGNWGAGDVGFTSFNPRTGEGGQAKILLMTGSTGGTANGATVSVYDFANPANTPLIAGTVPTTASPLNFVQFYGNTTAALGTGFSQSTSNTEIFFLDTAIANSLVRVPTPSARQWLPVN
jgi:hypothetical protein